MPGGYARYLLSLIHNISPLEIPFYSPPGSPPELKNNLGFISISHCKDACLIGWSRYPIGVDIEDKIENLELTKSLNIIQKTKNYFYLNINQMNSMKKSWSTG